MSKVRKVCAHGVYTDEQKAELKADAGIKTFPTDLTYECRLAPSGIGPLAYTWSDKPHRLLYDLCHEVERLEAENAELRGTKQVNTD